MKTNSPEAESPGRPDDDAASLGRFQHLRRLWLFAAIVCAAALLLFVSPAWPGEMADGLIEAFGAALTDVKWRIFAHAVSGQQIFLEGADDFVLIAEKRRVAIPYMGIMTFRGGLICEWRDYFDRALFDRLKAGETVPPEIAKLLDRPSVP